MGHFFKWKTLNASRVEIIFRLSLIMKFLKLISVTVNSLKITEDRSYGDTKFQFFSDSLNYKILILKEFL